MANFYVPETLSGKTLKQLGQEASAQGKYVPRLDVLAGQLGISETTPFTAGQSFNLPDDPGSGEVQFASSLFTPQAQFQQQQSEAFSAGQKAEEEGFLSALKERTAAQETLPAAAERIGGELGLPALRESALGLTQTLNQIRGDIRRVPEQQETIAKQVGISAPSLERRIASERGELARGLEPVAEAAGQISPALQSAEAQLGQRLGLLVAEQEKELRPFYQAQLPLLQDRLAREQANYTQDKQNELTLLLTNMSQNFQATQAELDRANQLAQAEMGYNNALEQIRFGTDEAIREYEAKRKQEGPKKNPLNYLQSSARISGGDSTSTFQPDNTGFSGGMTLEELRAAGYAQ